VNPFLKDRIHNTICPICEGVMFSLPIGFVCAICDLKGARILMSNETHGPGEYETIWDFTLSGRKIEEPEIKELHDRRQKIKAFE